MIDVSELTRTINNVTQYGYGFIDTIDKEKTMFNATIAATAVEILSAYIDSKAKLDPSSLHHVYEPGMAGDAAGRLFEFSTHIYADTITINGTFLESSVEPLTGGEPFRQRAPIMEAGASIRIEPVNGEILAFMDEDELVIISSGVTVEHPGGIDVAQSFGDTVYEFFNTYLTKGALGNTLTAMSRLTEFGNMFSTGAKAGRSAGVTAARQYLKRGAHEFI